MNSLTHATWWSTVGWEVKSPPEPFVAVERAYQAGDNNWAKLLEAAGYEARHRAGADGEMELQVHRHADGHLLCEFRDSGCRDHFFVPAWHAMPFLLTEYPRFVVQAAQAGLSDSMEQMARCFVAFVRHGHGERTVDEDGSWTLDDERRTKQVAAWERARSQATGATK